MIKRLAFTPGEPAGIGPDLAILMAQQPSNYELLAFADPELLAMRAQALQLPLKLNRIDLNDPPRTLAPGELSVIPLRMASVCEPGRLDAANSPYVLQCLDQAIAACQNQQCHAMVTGPVQKSIINEAGIAFSGHTEYLADKTNTQRVVMMLATEGLKVALVTTHLPLRNVADAINGELIHEIMAIVHQDLQHKFGIAEPRIIVCGLNPHAGEGGHLGREEIDIIEPALEQLRQRGIHSIGPLPADTAFTPKYLEQADAFVAMYHDQGLPVLKYKGFGQAANITLGLPIIRTSVDHGTALDLAGTGNVDPGSLQTAIDYALTMAQAINT